MFQIQTIVGFRQPFSLFSTNVTFETVGRGREQAILIHNGGDDSLVPLVRCTTRYEFAPQHFGTCHHQLASAIEREIARHQSNKEAPILSFNNIMIEKYTKQCTTMGYHSDQALDLAPNSWICLYSCYSNPEKYASRRVLQVKNKTTNEETEYLLDQNSIVFFSTETNRKFLHKIIPKEPLVSDDNVWLGLTFRTSCSLISFASGLPRFLSNGKLMSLNKPKSFILSKQKRTNVWIKSTNIPQSIIPSALEI
jgi:hypothetical protein